MKKRAVDKLHANAAGARGAFDAFVTLLDEPTAALFRKCFHYRPTKKNVIIVSTLSYAPMWTTSLPVPKLRKKLDALLEVLPELTGCDTAAARKCLKKQGFKKVAKKQTELAALRARFIRAMIMENPFFNGVRFLADGLCLNKKAPSVLVGLRGTELNLYVPVLKPDPQAISAVDICRGLVVDPLNDGAQKAKYERIWKDWPDTDFETIDTVRCTAVICGEGMSRAALARWAVENNPGGVDIVSYEDVPLLSYCG